MHHIAVECGATERHTDLQSIHVLNFNGCALCGWMNNAQDERACERSLALDVFCSTYRAESTYFLYAYDGQFLCTIICATWACSDETSPKMRRKLLIHFLCTFVLNSRSQQNFASLDLEYQHYSEHWNEQNQDCDRCRWVAFATDQYTMQIRKYVPTHRLNYARDVFCSYLNRKKYLEYLLKRNIVILKTKHRIYEVSRRSTNQSSQN